MDEALIALAGNGAGRNLTHFVVDNLSASSCTYGSPSRQREMQVDLETPVLGVRALAHNCNPGHLRKFALKSEFFFGEWLRGGVSLIVVGTQDQSTSPSLLASSPGVERSSNSARHTTAGKRP